MGAAVGSIKITSISGALTVTFTGTPKVYTTATLTTEISLPATIADGTTTTFYVASRGTYTLSVKDTNGTELAAAGNTTRTIDIETAGTVATYTYDTRLYANVGGDSGSSAATSSGGSVPVGVSITRMFAFAFDTPGLADGIDIYTPAVDEVLEDYWIRVVTNFDDTCFADMGVLLAGHTDGWFGFNSGPVPLQVSADHKKDLYGIASQGSATPPTIGSLSLFKTDISPGFNYRDLPGAFITADPVKLWVSVDGTLGGAVSAASQGEAIVYLRTVIPDPLP